MSRRPPRTRAAPWEGARRQQGHGPEMATRVGETAVGAGGRPGGGGRVGKHATQSYRAADPPKAHTTHIILQTQTITIPPLTPIQISHASNPNPNHSTPTPHTPIRPSPHLPAHPYRRHFPGDNPDLITVPQSRDSHPTNLPTPTRQPRSVQDSTAKKQAIRTSKGVLRSFIMGPPALRAGSQRLPSQWDPRSS